MLVIERIRKLCLHARKRLRNLGPESFAELVGAVVDTQTLGFVIQAAVTEE